MSQYGASSKNPPWARNTDVSGVSVAQQQLQTQMMNQLGQQGIMYQQNPQVFQPALGLQQPNMMPALNSGLSGINSAPQLYGQPTTVSYPVPRSLNSNAFGGGPVAPSVQQVQQSSSNPPPKQRVFTGTVTKVHDNFGFVDEDVFFQMSCCVKGSNPVTGDRVLVEASYNQNMPFKWNATRLQVLPMSGQSSGGGSGRKGFSDGPSNYNSAPPPVERGNDGGQSGFGRSRSPRRDRPRRERRDSDDDRKRRRDDRERSKEREKSEKEKGSTRSPSVRKRSKSPRKRRVRPAPRYMVHVPKIALDVPDADVLELRRRYNNLYIPSDFFISNFRWVDAFPPNTPFTMDRPCSFHIMHQQTEQVTDNKAVLDPPDADYLFSAKVMLMSMPEMGEFLKKCCQMTEDVDPDAETEGRDFVHPTRLVNFLVGLRGKNETMAIGGPWSPSLDGPDPDKDPQVLIRTAIRNCQALTGIDLSTCTQWYRFLEIYYRRSETTHKGKLVAARVETVVLFLPDVWSCVPTRLEWDGLHVNYKRQLDRKLKALLQMDTDEEPGTADEKENEDGIEVVKKEPTHWNLLDPKVMKVSDLRQELEARNMASKGLKSQLMARLQKALKTEQETEEKEKDENQNGSKEPDPEPDKLKDKEEDEEKRKKEEEERKKQLEKERSALEKRYELPENPHIVVHPNRHAKSGKFDCTTMSLSLLLDYRQDDTKEHSFEVSLFAELFNEMLMRDFGFRIYRALYEAADKAKEDEKEKERKKKEDKEKKDKEEKEKKDKDDGDNKKADGENDVEIISKNDDKPSEDGDRREKDNDKEREDKEDKKDRRDRDSKDRDKEKDKDKDKKKKDKMFTSNQQLLLAFVYFDQSHCGYILDKDVEELMYALGLNLSRAQVRRLIQAVLTKDTRDTRDSREALYYRRLTDKVKVDENGVLETNAEGESSTVQSINLEKLAFGNKRLLPVFASHQGGSPPSKRARREDSESPNKSDVPPEGYVMFKGGLLDVEKLMGQLKRSEKARADTENLLITLREELGEAKNSATASSNTVKNLSSELKDFKERLLNTSEELTRVQGKSDVYLSTLKDTYARIGHVLPGKAESVDDKSNIKMEVDGGNK